ncbi:hypothetical protein EMIHUDRAFT_424794 [Emiliania huxleyi CCMP1516]|uniref:Uncharacterized protein n=2 Tax=Emiliania huxleyi TaxID=2903 RepID=A0A0D3J8M7_EMIH1|nr:hypothetical protein EMIHUDRAFT_424794 [Emiliania huxleyi CCMP1516]EOD19862.1 hypothetical protein EMIHUDRAFT_424794 [Emiliania huxleyi CCMP1516]|mmetsp:Transcript_232/g.709  ORF Transcript_232/g.709 Transcript_232/m.709 type:complete len:163 (+) Transcript_232:1283-1771(+)|eukprot:XP_005772291.1 hypothetical protein EMIHUDRAFT_424794 [Emiliania huxleyi CCMP1516]
MLALVASSHGLLLSPPPVVATQPAPAVVEWRMPLLLADSIDDFAEKEIARQAQIAAQKKAYQQKVAAQEAQAAAEAEAAQVAEAARLAKIAQAKADRAAKAEAAKLASAEAKAAKAAEAKTAVASSGGKKPKYEVQYVNKQAERIAEREANGEAKPSLGFGF